MHYILEPDPEIEIVAGIEEPDAGLLPKYMQGIKLPLDEAATVKRVIVETSMDKYPDYFMTLHGPVVSRQFIDALQRSGVDNFDGYHAQLVCQDAEFGPHFIWNVVGRIACIDHGRAEYTLYKQQIARIQSLAIDESRIHGVRLFRLDEVPAVLVVTQDVRDALASLNGVVFAEAEGWSDDHWF
ncbi:imm11 family protein [Sorangium sp. So ce117]|uniref:imm11 family protein n=1 Tax=Sorangium sp. So ce117 TaxID=3133277 RepID=UPI003F6019D7